MSVLVPVSLSDLALTRFHALTGLCPTRDHARASPISSAALSSRGNDKLRPLPPWSQGPLASCHK
jgi:hypothetical protein